MSADNLSDETKVNSVDDISNNATHAGPGVLVGGRFLVLGRQGASVLGDLYVAEDTATDTPVTVKLLRSDLACHGESRLRFEREALASSNSSHANCAHVIDFGTLDDGRLYLVMEYLDGVLLSELLDREGTLPLGRALRIARHVLRGLCHAHNANVLHRNLNPDNILLTEVAGDPDFAKVLDFGLARFTGDASPGQIPLTRAGICFGTPSYMAPEWMTGSDIDRRSDLYSVSAILYEMIAGEPPFAGNSPQEILCMHASSPVPRLPDEAPLINELLGRGLAKSPGDRFADAAEYLAAIESVPLLDSNPRQTSLLFGTRSTPADSLKNRNDGQEDLPVCVASATPKARARKAPTFSRLRALGRDVTHRWLPDLPRPRPEFADRKVGMAPQGTPNCAAESAGRLRAIMRWVAALPARIFRGLAEVPGTLRRCPAWLLRGSKRVWNTPDLRLAASILGILLLAGAIGVLAGDEPRQGTSFDRVFSRWRHAGFNPGGFAAAAPGRTAHACQAGAVSGLSVVLCQHNDGKSAQTAATRARKQNKVAAAAAGDMSVVIVDRYNVDASRERTNALVDAFRSRTSWAKRQ